MAFHGGGDCLFLISNLFSPPSQWALKVRVGGPLDVLLLQPLHEPEKHFEVEIPEPAAEAEVNGGGRSPLLLENGLMKDLRWFGKEGEK